MKSKKIFPHSNLRYKEMMSYVTPDKNDNYLEEGASINPEAPQWAKEKYAKLKRVKAEMAELAKDGFKA